MLGFRPYAPEVLARIALTLCYRDRLVEAHAHWLRTTLERNLDPIIVVRLEALGGGAAYEVPLDSELARKIAEFGTTLEYIDRKITRWVEETRVVQ